MNTTVLVNKFQNLPETAQSMIIDFIDFISLKYKKTTGKKVTKTKITSIHTNPWQTLFNSLDKFTPDFMNDRNQPLMQQRELL